MAEILLDADPKIAGHRNGHSATMLDRVQDECKLQSKIRRVSKSGITGNHYASVRYPVSL